MCWLLNSHFPSVKPAFLHPLGPPRPGGQRKKRSRAWQSEQRRIMAKIQRVPRHAMVLLVVFFLGFNQRKMMEIPIEYAINGPKKMWKFPTKPFKPWFLRGCLI